MVCPAPSSTPCVLSHVDLIVAMFSSDLPRKKGRGNLASSSIKSRFSPAQYNAVSAFSPHLNCCDNILNSMVYCIPVLLPCFKLSNCREAATKIGGPGTLHPLVSGTSPDLTSLSVHLQGGSPPPANQPRETPSHFQSEILCLSVQKTTSDCF